MPAAQVQVQTEGGFPILAPSSDHVEYNDDEQAQQIQQGGHRLLDEDADEDEEGDGHERFSGAAGASAPLHDSAVVGDDEDDVDGDSDGDSDGGTMRARPQAEAETATRPSSATGDVAAAAAAVSPSPPRPPPDDDGWAWQLRQQLDHWRTFHSFEGAVLGLAASSPHGAASIIKVMTVCNLGSLLFFVHTGLWYVEEMRKAQHRTGGSFGGGGGGSPDIPSTQDLIDFSSATSSSGTRSVDVLSAVWRILLLGPVDGYAGGDVDAVSSSGGSLDTRLIWSWLVAQMFVGFVKLLLRLITLYQCDRVLSLSPTTSNDAPQSPPLLSSMMGDSGRRAEGTMPGGEVEQERNEDRTGRDRRSPWPEGRRLMHEAEARIEREREQERMQRRRLNRMVRGAPFRAHAAAGRAAQVLVAFGFVLYLVRGSRRLLSSDGRLSGPFAASLLVPSRPNAPPSPPMPFEGPDVFDAKCNDNFVIFGVCVSAANVLGVGGYYHPVRQAAAPRLPLPRGGPSCSVLLPAATGETEYAVAALEKQLHAITSTLFTQYGGPADCCHHDVHRGVACWWESEDFPSSPRRVDFAAAPARTKTVAGGGGGGDEATGTTAEAAEEVINSAVLLDVCCTNLIVCLFRALMALGVVHFHVVQERRAVHRRRVAMRRERRGLCPDEIGTMECAVFGEGARDGEGEEGGGGGVGSGPTAEDDRDGGRFEVEENRVMCSICLECYRTGDRLTVLPCDGRHRFHTGCIREWLVKCSTCPLCQGNLRSIMNMLSSSSSDYKAR